jgi:hypothetical protein
MRVRRSDLATDAVLRDAVNAPHAHPIRVARRQFGVGQKSSLAVRLSSLLYARRNVLILRPEERAARSNRSARLMEFSRR